MDDLFPAELCNKLVSENYVTESKGLPTINDILRELRKPGLDPREQASEFAFDENVYSIDDLREGMVLPGIVTNITAFGAFVDIGVHQDGLVHISRMCDKFIRHPSEVLKPGDIVTVWVLEVDQKKKRISLTMKKER